jgi:hypothetical protein
MTIHDPKMGGAARGGAERPKNVFAWRLIFLEILMKSLSKNDKTAVPDSLVPAVAVAAEFGITRRTPSSLA